MHAYKDRCVKMGIMDAEEDNQLADFEALVP